MTEYPMDRQASGYAIRYIRWLSDSGAATEVGPDAFALLVAIVTKEDELHYSRAPNFFNEQLATRCGIVSVHALARARQRAIDAGLLHYEPAAKRRPGRYFVCGFHAQSARNVEGCHAHSAGKAGGIRNPPYPIPSNPREKRPQFEKPRLEDVQAYCQERGNRISAEQFYDHYEANGWVQGSRGKPIINWQACVRTWERNEISTSANGNGRPDPALKPFPKRRQPA